MAGRADASIIDEDVEPAEVLLRRLNKVLPVGRGELFAELANQRLKRLNRFCTKSPAKRDDGE